MQIKYYTILEHADISVVQAWADVPDHRCVIVTKTLGDVVTRSLGVSKPTGTEHQHIFAETESALAGMIAEVMDPDMIIETPDPE
jgi:hypothetical protein